MRVPPALLEAIFATLDPLVLEMLRKLGPELTCVVLRGMADRIEKSAREAGRWDEKLYELALGMDSIAEQMAKAVH